MRTASHCHFYHIYQKKTNEGWLKCRVLTSSLICCYQQQVNVFLFDIGPDIPDSGIWHAFNMGPSAIKKSVNIQVCLCICNGLRNEGPLFLLAEGSQNTVPANVCFYKYFCRWHFYFFAAFLIKGTVSDFFQNNLYGRGLWWLSPYSAFQTST